MRQPKRDLLLTAAMPEQFGAVTPLLIKETPVSPSCAREQPGPGQHVLPKARPDLGYACGNGVSNTVAKACPQRDRRR